MGYPNMNYPTVVVIGGSGFIGSHLAAHLEQTPASFCRRVVIPTRHANHAKHLLPLPKVDVIETDVHDEAALQQLLQGADAVINLVGVLHSRPAPNGAAYGPDFARAHVELPRKIAAAFAACGVSRLLHMSALGVAHDAPSMYLRSKAAGEDAVRKHPGVTIFRPSVVFGEEDHFLNLFASLQKWFPVMPLGGGKARFQPIYVGDVAQAFVNALLHEVAIGKTYELAGPQVYTLHELVELAGAYAGHRRMVIDLPDPLARLQAMLLEHMPGGPLMSRDNLDSMKTDNVASGSIAPELDLTLTPLEAVAPAYLSGQPTHTHYDELRQRARR